MLTKTPFCIAINVRGDCRVENTPEETVPKGHLPDRSGFIRRCYIMLRMQKTRCITAAGLTYMEVLISMRFMDKCFS